MIPEEFPVLTASDILIDPDNYHVDELDPDSPSTSSGWLKRLFLYGACEIYGFNTADTRDYIKAEDTFKSIAGISKKMLIEGWEDAPKNTREVQAAVLNKLRIKMGYVEEYYR